MKTGNFHCVAVGNTHACSLQIIEGGSKNCHSE